MTRDYDPYRAFRTAIDPEPAAPRERAADGFCSVWRCTGHPDGGVTPEGERYCAVHAADFLAAFPRPVGLAPRPQATEERHMDQRDYRPEPPRGIGWSELAVGIAVGGNLVMLLQPLVGYVGAELAARLVGWW